jgi:hypothetical protein
MAVTINASSVSGLVQTADLSGQLALQANGVTVATASSSGFNLAPNATLNTANTFGMKNRIINGAMVIDQRNAGASVTPANTGQYLVDRWQYNGSQASKVTAQQNAGSVTPPIGFINYQGITSSSAYAITASDYFQFLQPIEGLNIADLAWGTANAKTVTLSFQVYSSLTGTFGGSLRNSATNRAYPFSYSIPTANTWTPISVTIAGDTTGTWLTTNGVGIYLAFSLGSGSTFSGTAGSWQAGNLISVTGATSVVATNGATFYITGVQLEVGTQATSFDFRAYGTELQLCQRYYETSFLSGGGYSNAFSTTSAISHTQLASFAVPKRAVPTFTFTSSDNSMGFGADTISRTGAFRVYADGSSRQYTYAASSEL